MEKQTTKNYGCIAGIGMLILVFIVLNIYVYVSDIIEVILSNPIVIYGIPIVFLLILYIRSQIKKEL